MKVLVIGAAGKSGMAVVKRALSAGHDVTALVHTIEGYSPDSTVRVIEGDARDRSTVDSAVLGQDAVIDTIGGKLSFKPTTLESSPAATLIASMRSSGVRRLVAISMVGAGESEANTNWYERLILATVLRSELKDKTAMEAVINASGLDWTVVRLPFLADDPATGNIHVVPAESGETAHKLTRADLAALIIAELSSNLHLNKAVAIANS